MTTFQIPILEAIISMAFIDFKYQANIFPGSDLTAVRVVLYLLAVFNGLLFLGIAVLLQKLYIIRIPSVLVHWAASNT